MMILKKLKNVLLIVLICLWASCVNPEAPEFDVTFSIFNQTETGVQLFFFKIDNEVIDSEIIGPNNSFDTQITLRSRNFLENPNGNSIIAGERLRIVFNNERFMQYSFTLEGNENPIFSLPVDRNPFRIGSYENIGDIEFLYTINEEDFENAIPCDGSCE